MKMALAKRLIVSMALVAAMAISAYAGEADVNDVKIRDGGNRIYDFTVEVAHADTGWEHYADKWEIVDGQGNVIATRVLHHPHVDEQPFTRSLSGVMVAEGIREVTVRAHDSVHGYGGRTIQIRLP